MAKTLTLDFSTAAKQKKIASSYNIKSYGTVSIKTGTTYQGDEDFLGGIKSVTASGTTVSVTIFTNQDHTKSKTVKFTNVTPEKFIQAIAGTTVYYGGTGDDAKTIKDFYYGVKGWESDAYNVINTETATSATVTGTIFNDDIDLHDAAYTKTTGSGKKKKTVDIGATINSGLGNDRITGTTQNDTITGGAGKNTIVYDPAKFTDGKFGTDTVKLTNGEDLVIDLKGYTLTSDAVKQKLSVAGNDLLLTLGEGNVIKLAGFAKSNVVGNGSVKLLLDGVAGEASEVSIDLNNEDLLLTIDTLTKGVVSGTRFSDYVVAGTGNQKLTGGAGRDAFTVRPANNGVITITDAVKEDCIYINDEAVNLDDLKYKKNGNNLEIFYGTKEDGTLDEKNKIVVQNYFKTAEAKRFDRLTNGDDEIFLSEDDIRFIIQSNTSVTGTANGDDIIISGAKKAFTVTGGKGNDEITVTNSKGAATYVFNPGDGEDTITGAKKGDVIQINANIEGIGYTKDNDDLIITYPGNNGNSITLEDFFTEGKASSNIDNIKFKNGKKWATVSISKDMILVKELEADVEGVAEYNKTTPYHEEINIEGALTDVTLTGLTSGDCIFFLNDSSISYSRTDDGGLVINDKVKITDFFKNGKDFSIKYTPENSDPVTISTKDAVINVNLTDATAVYQATKYSEVFTGTGSVKGLAANDNISVTGDNVTYTRTGVTNNLTIADGTNEITVTDFNFAKNTTVKVNSGLVSANNTTLLVELNGETYTGTSYKEIFTGNGVVKSFGTNDEIKYADGDVTFHRTVGSNHLDVICAVPNGNGGTRDYSIQVVDFFKNGKDITVNDESTANMELLVNVTGQGTYAASKYNETIICNGTGKVSGLTTNDKISMYAIKTKIDDEDVYSYTYDRVAGSNDLQITGQDGTLTVVNYFATFKNGATLVVSDAFSEFEDSVATATINTFLHNKTFNANDGYNYNFTGSGTVTNIKKGDTIHFTEGEPTYTLTGSGLAIKSGGNTVTLSGYNHKGGVLPDVYVGDATEPAQRDILNVSGLKTFNGTELTGFTGVKITGTANNDTLTGSDGRDTISGGKGVDSITGGKGKDILTGGDGNDKFIFSAGDGEDTIKDGTKGDVIILNGVSANKVTARNENERLVISYGSGDKITVENYSFASGAKNNIDTIQVGSEKLSIAELLKASPLIPEDDTEYEKFTPYYKADDFTPPTQTTENTFAINPSSYLYVSAEGNDLVFKWWDGNSDEADDDGNIVKSIKGYFAGESDYKYIKIGAEDPVLIDEYAHIQIGTDKNEEFDGHTNPEEMNDSDDIIFAGEGDDKINTNGGINYVNAGEGNNKIYFSDQHWDETYVLDGGGVDTLVFPETAQLSAEITTNYKGEVSLHISYYGEVPLDEPDEEGNTTRYYDGTVEILDYNKDSSVKYVQMGNVKLMEITDIIPQTWYGTSRDDEKEISGNDTEYVNADDPTKKISVSRTGDDIFYFGTGNDSLTFTGKFGDDTFFSEAEYNDWGQVTNKDTFNFTDLSLVNDELDFQYYEYSQYDEEQDGYLSIPSLRIYTPSTEEERGSDTTYIGYFDTTLDDYGYEKYVTPTLQINDANGDSYTIDRYKTEQQLNWKSEDEKNKNHVAFIDTGKDETTHITSNTKTNLINVINGNISYSYQGGEDTVYSSNASNAYYSVFNFDENTRLAISDDNSYEDDFDTLAISNDTNNMRLIMNVQKDDNDYIWYGPKLIHLQNFNYENVKGIITGSKDVNGIYLSVHQANMEKNEYGQSVVNGYRCGIEKFSTGDYLKGLDIEAWKNQIVKNVQAWLNSADNDGEYTSAWDAFNRCTNQQALNRLYQCYNVYYQDITDAKTVYQEFESTTDDDEFNFKEGNNRVTFASSEIGNDTINSGATKYCDSYTDELIFGQKSGLSIKEDTLEIVADGDDIVIGEKGNLENNSVTYTDFLSDDAHNELDVINYTNGYQSTYHVKVEEDTYVNMASQSFHTKDYDPYENYVIFFKNNSGDQNGVESNAQRNIYHTLGDQDFGYNGHCGEDKIYTHSDVSNDDYFVQLKRTDYSPTDYASLYINDNGGDNDVLHLNNVDATDIRFMCDVDDNGDINYDKFMVIHTDKFSADTLVSAVNNDLTEGVIKVDAKGTDSAFGIEKLSTTNNIAYNGNIPYAWSGIFDTDSWTQQIASNVQSWLNSADNTGSYTSAYEAFEDAANIDAQALGRLVNCYNVEYTINQG